MAGLGGVLGFVTGLIGSDQFTQILSVIVAVAVVPLMVVLEAKEQGGFL